MPVQAGQHVAFIDQLTPLVAVHPGDARQEQAQLRELGPSLEDECVSRHLRVAAGTHTEHQVAHALALQ